MRAAGEITYRETVKSVRNGSFIGRVGALALESARGEDFDERERAFPVGSRGLPFAIRSHARKLGELSRKWQPKEMAARLTDHRPSYFDIFAARDVNSHETTLLFQYISFSVRANPNLLLNETTCKCTVFLCTLIRFIHSVNSLGGRTPIDKEPLYLTSAPFKPAKLSFRMGFSPSSGHTILLSAL